MWSQLRAAIVAIIVLTVLTGVIYPLVVTGIAQLVFPHQANGSLIKENDTVVGSSLIGQSFDDDPKYFWGRLSATSPAPYDGSASGGSNLGPTNPALVDNVKKRLDALDKADPDNHERVPVDLVTASGSGLDPHISPAAAEYQVRRVARLRGKSEDDLRKLIAEHTEDRTFGLLGEPRVNVLELNLALDKLKAP